jgi:hypothetical protein
MIDSEINSDKLYTHLLANSSFTPRQLSIISKRLQGHDKDQNISSGAYYRQVKQCRRKVISTLYSLVLMQSLGIVDIDASSTLSRVSNQLAVIFASRSSDIVKGSDINDVIYVIDELVKRIVKL